MTQAGADLVTGKRVLFVSTKNADYIRNTQELSWLKHLATATATVVFSDKSYALRIFKTTGGLIKHLLYGDFDVLFIGFAPQFLFFLFPFFPKSKPLIIDFFISFFDTLVDDRSGSIKSTNIPCKKQIASWSIPKPMPDILSKNFTRIRHVLKCTTSKPIPTFIIKPPKSLCPPNPGRRRRSFTSAVSCRFKALR